LITIFVVLFSSTVVAVAHFRVHILADPPSTTAANDGTDNGEDPACALLLS
jgi:hypothetical protein